ncbi:Sir2 family NAD-dependent protein deacetylase [Parapedobacter sp. 10938]|uniref:Sir2 family NAD-dependent protein deacetylase n=1 Tax=Parapedobacter flavus TaxID=3110225 RepID=UPI002DB6DC7B|nr:Sir2 family NAD-dependent protein deacetylase [Parapedobacter sp. 10938]MEC3881221.1 Sir2 family NAD-dependent protein deacetylase [Parapedobacter sp. 10938]
MKKIVVLSGAGISAESGLKTFRDLDGLWENYKIEEVATIDAWHQNPTLVLQFYDERRAGVMEAQPNLAHQLLADLQAHFDVQIITQNVDDLHERAGSKKVLHLHGEITKMRSVKNEMLLFPASQRIKLGDLAEDGGQLRPHIVWFGEDVPMIAHAIPLMAQADYLLVIGTSLQVYPAAGLIDEAPQDCRRFLIDRQLLAPSKSLNYEIIQDVATAGMKILYERLFDQENIVSMD